VIILYDGMLFDLVLDPGAKLLLGRFGAVDFRPGLAAGRGVVLGFE
jgi:hypothetical protein